MKNLSLGKKIRGWDFLTDKNLDKTGIDLIGGDKLPHQDASVDNIYISHLFEHLYDSSIIGLVRECYRVLKRRGILRIVAVDINLYYHAYMREDREMFYCLMEYMNKKLSYDYHKASLEQLMLFAFASQLSDLCGGSFVAKTIDDKEFTDFDPLLNEVGQNMAYNYILQGNIDLVKHKDTPYYINWLSKGKVIELLLHEIRPEIKKGFPLVYISQYGQSVSPIMRDLKVFDNDFPEGSMFIEALR